MKEHPAYKQMGMSVPNPYPGLECPACGKWGVELNNVNSGECPHCRDQFCEDDLCCSCEKLVKGSCYYCRMD